MVSWLVNGTDQKSIERERIDVLNLTPLEREILNHRLEAPDCIAECLDAETESVDRIAAEFIKGNFNAGFAIDRTLAEKILEDAVDGSTYLGAAIDNVSPQRERAIYRVGCSLAQKVSELIGRRVSYPWA